MADIISLDKRQQLTEKKKTELIRKRKILAVQKIFQCTQCPFKCKKCGTNVGERHHNDEENQEDKIPYILCESCYEEYMDYIDRLNGEGDSECYWHNKEWSELWKRWMEYQDAIDRYMKSESFMKLLQELREPLNEN